MFTEWKLTDDDCCQHIRKDNRKYELIQYVWFDVSDEDFQAGLHSYGIMTGEVNLNDLTDDEVIEIIKTHRQNIFNVIDSYGYATNEIIAEYYMEDISRQSLIAQFDTQEEAEAFINNYIKE